MISILLASNLFSFLFSLSPITLSTVSLDFVFLLYKTRIAIKAMMNVPDVTDPIIIASLNLSSFSLMVLVVTVEGSVLVEIGVGSELIEIGVGSALVEIGVGLGNVLSHL